MGKPEPEPSLKVQETKLPGSQEDAVRQPGVSIGTQTSLPSPPKEAPNERESSHSSLAFLQNELLRIEGAAPSSAASGAIASTSSATLASSGDNAAHSEGNVIRQ